MNGLHERAFDLRRYLRGNGHSAGVWVVLALLIGFGLLRYENFGSAYNVASFLNYNAMFIAISIGMCFVIMTGGIDLWVGSVAAFTSVVAAYLSPWGIEVALPGGVLCGMAFGGLNAFFIIAMRIPPFIATLATMLGAKGGALVISGAQTISVDWGSKADVDVDAHHLEARPLRHLREERARVADRHAELVAAHPGGDVRMAPGVDVGVHPQRHAGAAALARRLGVDALQLAARFGVDRLEAEGDRPRDLGAALADAGEDDLLRREAGLQGDLDLADGIAVGAGAEALDQAHQAERRVRLERVVDAVPAAGQGGGQARVTGADQGGAVDVAGRPDLARDGRQRDAVADPGAGALGEADGSVENGGRRGGRAGIGRHGTTRHAANCMPGTRRCMRRHLWRSCPVLLM